MLVVAGCGGNESRSFLPNFPGSFRLQVVSAVSHFGRGSFQPVGILIQSYISFEAKMSKPIFTTLKVNEKVK